MSAISKWLTNSYAENFRAGQVMVRFCPNQYEIGDITFSSGYNVDQVANATRYKTFAKQFPLKYVSGSRAVLKWKTVTGHHLSAEKEMPWRVELSGDSINLYRYYVAFNNSLHTVAYPLASQKSVCVFIVYNLQGYLDRSDMENFLFASGIGAVQRSVCFSPSKFARGGKRCIRIYGVDVLERFLEFSDWGELNDPSAVGHYNVLAIWWRPSGKKSSLWINYGKDHRGDKMLEFDASKDASGAKTAVENYTEGDYPLNGRIANFEAYDTDFMCEEFIQARMKYLSDHYGVEDSPYDETNLERGAWESVDHGVDTREVSPKLDK